MELIVAFVAFFALVTAWVSLPASPRSLKAHAETSADLTSRRELIRSVA
jgi:hypothetical protein